jgi:hypothetical protein
MRTIFLLLMLSALGPCLAQPTFTLQPSPALSLEPVSLRIDNSSGCYPATSIGVERTGDVVGVTAQLTDAGNCQAEFPTPRFVDLGTFPPGTYQVQVTQCTNAPPPLPECALQAMLPLTVFGSSGAVFTVPALSGAVALSLVLLMMGMGAFGGRHPPTE